MAHRPDVIVCRLADCTEVVVELNVLVQRYTQNLDVVTGQWYRGAGDVD